ncbi:MAG TPA: major outer membrane protein, partial [Campylobacterales bacterium]|nr:major outer membrane protein [Campylobacterales bacterium]
MKFTKLSLAALVAMGIASSASAVENVKVDGQIKLWYQTTDTTKGSLAADTDTTKNDGLFKQKGATGDLVAKLRATGDLTKKVGFGTTFYAMTSGGLENNLVAAETSQGTTAGTEKNPYWLGEAYFTYKAGKTIAKIGRQELDTPLAFTETWNAAPNTFEAFVA